MLYLFCSAATTLYKRDALESMSYPKGHIYKFRYAQKYVAPELLSQVLLNSDLLERDGLIVFADRTGAIGAMDFEFYPVRRIKLLRCVSVADAVYLYFRFDDFARYDAEGQSHIRWNAYLKALPARPWPPSQKSGRAADNLGYFAFESDSTPPQFSTEEDGNFTNWQRVSELLDKTKDLAQSTFCLVLGFFQVKQDWLKGVYTEERLESIDNGYDSIYPVPMGKGVVLKVLLSRPSFNYDEAKDVRTLKVTAASDAFSALSKDKIYSESRYNEDRTTLVCKRVFDSALSMVAIEEQEALEVRSPRIVLLTKVDVPNWVLTLVIGGVVLSALLLAMDADTVTFVAGYLDEPMRSSVIAASKTWASMLKLLAAVPTGIAAFFVFKRLPIK